MSGRVLVLVVTACAVPSPGQPAITAVEPASAVTDVATPIAIEGTGFHVDLSDDLDRGTTAFDGCTASLGTEPIADAMWRSEQLIEGTVPAGLPLGFYAVTVTCGGRTTTLADAFEVTAEPIASGPFGAPTVIAALSSPDLDDDPSMTSDRLELYFNSNRLGGVGGTDVWWTSRASTADPWRVPEPLVAVNSVDSETTPKISRDGLTLYFSSDRAGGLGLYDIWVSTRPDRASPWSPPVDVPELSTASTDTGANLSPSGLAIIIESELASPGDLFIARRASLADPWGTPVAVSELNTLGDEADPALPMEDRAVAFVSDRPGGLGGTDLYLATRASAAVPFDTPVELTELDSVGTEEDPWLTDDMHYIMFTSDRTGDTEIYEASR